MKNIVCLSLLLLPIAAGAQIQKGKWLVGGNALFDYAQSRELRLTTLQVAPMGGYFAANKMALGLRPDFGSETFDWTDDRKRNSYLSVAPFLRYYFLPVYNKVNLLADASFGWRSNKIKSLSYQTSHAYATQTFSLAAGPAIFLNEHTAIELTLGYYHASRGRFDSTATNGIRLGVGFQIHLGKAKE